LGHLAQERHLLFGVKQLALPQRGWSLGGSIGGDLSQLCCRRERLVPAEAWSKEYHEQCGGRSCPNSTSYCQEARASTNPAWLDTRCPLTVIFRSRLGIDRLLKMLACNVEVGQIH
jgi:hypothetical protein